MGVPPLGRSLILVLIFWTGLVCAQTAEAQIWVVTESDGSERFTSSPEPGARLYMPTRYGSSAATVAGEFGSEIRSAAAVHGLEPALLRAVIATESAFDPRAVSSKGAQGLMQLMPATARELGVRNVWDPRENIEAGARHLSRLVGRYGELTLALAAYNAGEGAVDRHGGIPPYRETRDYVRRVLDRFKRYQGQTLSAGDLE